MHRISWILAAAVLLQAPAWAAQAAQAAPQKPQFSVSEIEAAKADPKAYTLDAESISIVKLGEVAAPAQPAQAQTDPPVAIPKPPTGSPLPAPPGGGTGTDPLVIIDKIINIAERIWKIIEANKPVVDINTTYANAVPDGITHWAQLAGWEQPKGTRYGFYAKNLYGVKVIDVEFIVFRTCGGNYKGKGKYLNSVTSLPVKADVAWAYKLTIDAEVPSVANVGTSEDPIASMMANLKWQIDTAVKHSEGTWVYYLQGDGVFRELAGPFDTASRENLRRSLEKQPLPTQAQPVGRVESLKARTAVGW